LLHLLVPVCFSLILLKLFNLILRLLLLLVYLGDSMDDRGFDFLHQGYRLRINKLLFRATQRVFGQQSDHLILQGLIKTVHIDGLLLLSVFLHKNRQSI